jgi:hypothetical protein
MGATMAAAELRWIRSSYTTNSDACVEFALDEREMVLVRDTKDPFGPLLCFSPQAWCAFVLLAPLL